MACIDALTCCCALSKRTLEHGRMVPSVAMTTVANLQAVVRVVAPADVGICGDCGALTGTMTGLLQRTAQCG